MRHRTMACLLVLTVGDYLLWDWSLAGNHDILSLLAGLTLLPLAVVSLGLLVLATLGMLARLARVSSTMARSMRAPREIAATDRATAERGVPGAPAVTPKPATAPEPAGSSGSPKPKSSSSRLAA